MGDLKLDGSTSGTITVTPTAVAGTNTITLPASTGTVALTASPTFSGTITFPATGTWTSAGNVGIGTTSPARKLDIEEAGTNYQLRIGDAGGLNYYDIGRDTSNGLLTFYGSQAAASGYVFSTVNGERMRIDTSGNLLVGTTSQLNGSYGSILNLKGGSTNGIVIQTTATNWNPLTVLTTSGTLCGYISSNNTSISFNATSDYRLKENVIAMTTGLAIIQALNPVTYDWISDKSKGEGFIAHELAEVVPLAVNGKKDAVNDDGSIKPQGVDYSKIVVHLVAAIQELSAKNDALEARLAALEAK